MSDKIEKVEMYKCAITGKLFTTQKAAKSNATKALKMLKKQEEEKKKAQEEFDNLEYKKNYLRNNLSDIHDLSNMLVKLCKEYYDIDIKDLKIDLTFNEKVSNAHSCPLNGITNWKCDDNKPIGYPGWDGRISGYFSKKNYSSKFNDSISDFLKQNFLVFNTGTGYNGRFNECKLDILLQLYLDDFPLIKEKYKTYKENYLKAMNNNKVRAELNHIAWKAASVSKIAENKYTRILKVEELLKSLRHNYKETIEKLIDEYIKNNPIELEELCSDYGNLSRIFKQSYY